MSKQGEAVFKRALRRYEEAVKAYSWRGSQMPEDIPAIEVEYARAKEALLIVYRRHTEGKN